MEKFYCYEWDGNREVTIVVLSEEDVLNENRLVGFGYEIVILPKKFETLENNYLNEIRMIAKFRTGKLIYI